MKDAPVPGGIGAWAEFARLRQIVGEWGLPLVLLAAIAARPPVAWETGWAALVWLAIAVFCHLLNDLEDAAMDRRAPGTPRNPVAAGTISMPLARGATLALGLGSLAAALTLPLPAALAAAGVWVLGVAYSWRPLRWKGVPGADLLSHGGMAGATLLLFAGLSGSARDAVTWMLVLGVSLFSAAGGLHNQLRDYRTDRRAGLANTTAVLGVVRSRRLKWILYATGVAWVGCGLLRVSGWVSLPEVSLSLAPPSAWVIVAGSVAAACCGLVATLGLLLLRRARRQAVRASLPPAAVVIAVYGWSAWKRKCIESLLKQRYPGSLEIVLAFQDAQDAALAEARRLKWDAHARLVVSPVPAGWTGAASNYAHGAAATEAEHLVLACDDTLAQPDSVAALVSRLLEGASVVSAVPLVTHPASIAAWVSAAFYNVLAVFGWAPGVFLGSAAAWGGLMAVRRTELERAGGMGVMRGQVTEDLALAQALRGAGRAALGPVIRSPIGSAPWSRVWPRFRRLAVMALYQSPHGRAVTLAALGLQYAYLGLPGVALLAGSGDLWVLCAILAVTRWAFVGAASIPAGLGLGAFLVAPLVDVLHVAALGLALVNRGFSWSGIPYRVLSDGLERR